MLDRIRLRWVVGGVAVLVIATVAGWPVYVHPRTDRLTSADPADAVLALGGRQETAWLATDMVKDGRARHAVISNPYGPWTPAMVAMCQDPPPNRTCFDPTPGTTRGEAREIARLAEENNWDDVVVIAPTFHISRARYVVGRCYRGRLRMVDPHLHYSPVQWPLQYVYQTVGFLKAALQRGC